MSGNDIKKNQITTVTNQQATANQQENGIYTKVTNDISALFNTLHDATKPLRGINKERLEYLDALSESILLLSASGSIAKSIGWTEVSRSLAIIKDKEEHIKRIITATLNPTDLSFLSNDFRDIIFTSIEAYNQTVGVFGHAAIMVMLDDKLIKHVDEIKKLHSNIQRYVNNIYGISTQLNVQEKIKVASGVSIMAAGFALLAATTIIPHRGVLSVPLNIITMGALFCQSAVESALKDKKLDGFPKEVQNLNSSIDGIFTSLKSLATLRKTFLYPANVIDSLRKDSFPESSKEISKLNVDEKILAIKKQIDKDQKELELIIIANKIDLIDDAVKSSVEDSAEKPVDESVKSSADDSVQDPVDESPKNPADESAETRVVNDILVEQLNLKPR